MPLKLALAVRETVAGRRLGALEGGRDLPPLPMHPWVPPRLTLEERGGGLGPKSVCTNNGPTSFSQQ